MGFYQFKREQIIPASIDDVWTFISAPNNLRKITPPEMEFKITSGNEGVKMHPGMIISYHVKPLLGISTTWVTEITQVKHKEFFVDEQRFGPYKMWHHQHKIKETPIGVLMSDIISYVPPFGFIGTFSNSILIQKKLNQIFDFRKVAIEKVFEL